MGGYCPEEELHVRGSQKLYDQTHPATHQQILPETIRK